MGERNSITILGLGNILLGDEGFGVHFARWFEEKYRLPDDVRVVDGGVLGYVLLDIICSCDHLLVVDAIRAGDEPGSIYRFTREELEAKMPPPTSAHEVTFMDVLFKAELIGEIPSVVFLCIVPGYYGEMDLEMSPRLREKFPVMEKLLLKELELLGVEPQ
jgi:hydrogenase maturation protease